MKFKQGWIGDGKGKMVDVVVDSKTDPVKVKDLCLGIGSIALGVIFLMQQSFRSGSQAHETAEYQTLNDLGLLDNPEEVNKTE